MKKIRILFHHKHFAIQELILLNANYIPPKQARLIHPSKFLIISTYIPILLISKSPNFSNVLRQTNTRNLIKERLYKYFARLKKRY